MCVCVCTHVHWLHTSKHAYSWVCICACYLVKFMYCIYCKYVALSYVYCILVWSHAFAVPVHLVPCMCTLKGISISTDHSAAEGHHFKHPSILLLQTPKHQKPCKQPRWREITLCVISLPLTLMSALPFMSVIVGDYFNCEKGSR